MSSNKDVSEKNQVAEEWRSLNQEQSGFYTPSIESLFNRASCSIECKSLPLAPFFKTIKQTQGGKFAFLHWLKPMVSSEHVL